MNAGAPFTRVDGNNRVFNTKSDGFENSGQPNRCITTECMAWREVHFTGLKDGASKALAGQGFCGMMAKPEYG